MCGIVGKIMFDSSATVEADQIKTMMKPMNYRGPDSSGIHLDANIGLGHNRLSIIDLSTGDQPMCNEDASVWIVLNGEIYNYLTLREQLRAKGHTFRSESDTEVIIHAYEEYGPGCVEKLRGMFAFAIWDANKRRLFVARDRVGIKPLYYFHSTSTFYFASELKAIISEPGLPRAINFEALRTFFSFNYLPGSATLFKGIFRLSPGHYLMVENGQVIKKQYWDLKYSQERWGVPYEKATEDLYDLLARTVRDHMIADVPVGILLSGGVDSSALLSYAVQESSKKIKTFTVGFDDGNVVDERPYARSAAQKFGSEHFEISITAEDFWNFLPQYVWHMEEPVCEPPAVALYYVTKLAQQHVKVVLSGEGGDEAFGGYPNYPRMLQIEQLKNVLGPLSRWAGVAGGLLGRLIADARYELYGYACGRPLASHYFSRTSSPVCYFNRNAEQIFSHDFLEATSSISPAQMIGELLSKGNPQTFLDQMLYIDSKTWLPDDLLIKADKITMANSIELRVPFLDHTVMEFAASLPRSFKVRGRETKRILKSTFARILPEEVITRKKAGFPVPYESWLATTFDNQIREMLLNSRAEILNYCDRTELSHLIENHHKNGHHAKEIFSLVVAELWHRQFLHRS